MENVSERGMRLLAECICSASEDARLLSKTALQQAFAEVWRLPDRTPSEEMSSEGTLPEGALPEIAFGNRQDSALAAASAETATLSRRELFAALLGNTSPETVRGPVSASPETADCPSPPVAEPAAPDPATPDPPVAEQAAPEPPLADPLPDFEPLLAATLAANPDLAVVTLAGPEPGEDAYHFLPLLSATYAGILAGRGDPARLMAATVRDNSRDYPRPIPLDLFEYPPFDYSPEMVQTCLKALANDPACADIRMAESSVGTVYLYSSLYLEHDYAAFLADREDVGLVLNP